MNYLGEGWQCIVYDLENGRVLKKRRSLVSQCFKILRTGGLREIWKGELLRSDRDYKQSLQLVNRLSASPMFDIALLGNPIIKNLNYTQDKVVPLGEMLDRATFEESKELLRQYVQLVKYLWKFGIHEKSMKFRTATGVSGDGILIVIDFGEVTTDKKAVVSSIATKRWLRSNSYKKTINEKLKLYYAELMEQTITVQALQEIWHTF
jgi:hypothetical protein